MHTSFFKSIAGSLAALALGVSVATTPALAHSGGGGGDRHRSPQIASTCTDSDRRQCEEIVVGASSRPFSSYH
jgi:hypothetical protein